MYDDRLRPWKITHHDAKSFMMMTLIAMTSNEQCVASVMKNDAAILTLSFDVSRITSDHELPATNDKELPATNQLRSNNMSCDFPTGLSKQSTIWIESHLHGANCRDTNARQLLSPMNSPNGHHELLP
jgi:hypothetical protein